MFKPPEFREGDQAGVVGTDGVLRMGGRLAEALQTAALELVRLGKFSAAAPFSLEEGTDGRRLAVNLPEEFWAKLSGTGNPYSFVEQQFVAGSGFSDLAAGRSGSNAYESTGRAGLAGKVVRLAYQEVSNDWRFQYLGYGCRWTIVVRGCTAGAVSGATVTLTQSGTTVATGTTDATGQVVFINLPTGTYTVTVGATGAYAAWTMSVAHTCSQTTAIYLTRADGQSCTSPGVQTVCFTPDGCTEALPAGQGISVSGPSGFAVSGVTGSDGAFCFNPPTTGSYTIAVTPTSSKFVSNSATYTVGPTTTALGTTLTPATGYVCVCCCNFPWPETMTVSAGGLTCTVTYQGSGIWGGCSTMTLAESTDGTGNYPCINSPITDVPCAIESGGTGVCSHTDNTCTFNTALNGPTSTVAVAVRVQCVLCTTSNSGVQVSLFPSCCSDGSHLTDGSCSGIDVGPYGCTGNTNTGVGVTLGIAAQCEIIDFEFDVSSTTSEADTSHTNRCLFGASIIGSVTE